MSGIHDQESDVPVDMVIARGSVASLWYPKRSDLTTYWTGNCIFGNASYTVPSDNVETWSASFVGNGALTPTGFS